MNQPQNLPNQQEILDPDLYDDEIDILGLIQTLGEEKWLLLGLPFFCACVAAVISFYLTPTYTSKATFVLPEKQPSSASAVIDQLGGVGGLSGGLIKSPIEMYVAFMQSNTVQDVIIAELDLIERYKANNQEDARKTLQRFVKVTVDKKSSLIMIEAQDQSPEFSAKLANSYLKPFQALLNRMYLEEARQRRDFFFHQTEVISQRPFRDPFVQATLMNSIIKQYEAARIDESRRSQILFPIDVAQPPQKRSSPKRGQIVFFVGATVFFLVLIWVFIKRKIRQAQNDPTLLQKFVMMKNAWKLRE